MERDMFKFPEAVAIHANNSLVSTTASSPPFQPDSLDLNNQEHIVAGLPLPSTLQRDNLNGFDINYRTTACATTETNASAFTSGPMLGRAVTRVDSQNSSCLHGNSNLCEQLEGGVLIPAASLANLLMTRNSLHNGSINVTVPRSSMDQLDSTRTSASFGCPIISSPHSFLAEEAHMRSSSQFTQNVDAEKLTFSGIGNASDGQQNTTFKYTRDLSLSLASILPDFYGENFKNHGGYTINSGGSQYSWTESGFDFRTTEFSPRAGAFRQTQFSNMISGSVYLQVIQNILAPIASYSVETLDLSQISYTPPRTEAGQNSQSCSSQLHGRDRYSHEVPDALRIDVQNDPARRRFFESKKSQLLALLQAVDDSYSQCLDGIHTVVSAFHAATELDSNIHACFALHTVSTMYKGLRERISKQILSIGVTLHGLYSREERSPETSCFERQWALQLFKRKDHQFWRPQRGLPERSVAILRAWMFKNFLHPYPKDSEKHILAIKSGLTRSQVSNWFINARVRLWKPMIDDMYSEMNKRKMCHNEGSYSNYGGLMNTNNRS